MYPSNLRFSSTLVERSVISATIEKTLSAFLHFFFFYHSSNAGLCKKSVKTGSSVIFREIHTNPGYTVVLINAA